MPKTETEATAILAALKAKERDVDAANAEKARKWEAGEERVINNRTQEDVSAEQAKRLRSLAHDLESEICVDCEIQYDSEGMIIAVIHRSLDIATAKAGLIDGTWEADDDGNVRALPQPEI